MKELEPTRFPEPEEDEKDKPSKVEIEAEEPLNINDADLLDEITGQMSLFD